jgi:hypothetical protein
MKQKEQSRIIKSTTVDDLQLDVKFKDGKLIHMSTINNNGELHLTTENMSLIDEIKILIRKLWN